MSTSQKHVQSGPHRDVLRDEANLLLNEDCRTHAIEYYQAKCSCSTESAIAFIEQVDKERMKYLRAA